MVKADAHFVDCTPSDGDAETWQAVRPFTYSKTNWKINYIALNSAVEVLDEDYAVSSTIDLPGSTSAAYTIDIDGDGNIAVGVNPDVAQNNDNGILKYNSSGELQQDFYTPDEDWPFANDVFTALRFTHDSLYLYAILKTGSTTPYLYKFNNTTGAEEWNVAITGSGASYGLEIDSSDNVYINYNTYGNGHRILKYDADGDLDTTYQMSATSALLTNRDIHIDEDLDRMYACGASYVGGATTQIAAINWTDNDTLRTFQLQNSSSIYAWAATTKGDYVYVASDRATHPSYGVGSVWKLTKDLEFVAKYDTGYQASHIWIDWLDRIVVLGGAEDKIYVLGDDLSLTTSNTCTSSSGESYGSEGLCVPSGIAIGRTGSVTQDRTIAFPSGYGHLEGEECCVLADGAVHPKVTVSDGLATLNYSATTTHIGLCYDSLLQPMKINGEVHVKRISKLIPQLYETLGGKYGEDADALDTIVFRTAGDELDDSPDLFTGHKELPFDGSYNRQGDLWFKQEQPLPMTVIGAAVVMQEEVG